MEAWVQHELATSHFGDIRLSQRFMHIVDQLSQAPHTSIPEAMGNAAEVKATYRFWDNDKVNEERILNPHRARTLGRIKAERQALVLHDTSEENYTAHAQTQDLGYLDHPSQRGLKMHTSLAASVQGVPLGILRHDFWRRDPRELGKASSRKKPLSQRESRKWLDSFADANASIEAPTEIIHIADREADLYDLFAAPRPAHVQFLIRASHNRRLSDGAGKLFEILASTEDLGTLTVEVSARKGQSTREALVRLRCAKVRLAAPQNKPTAVSEVPLSAIEAYEPHPPKGVKALRWVLLTTLPITGPQQVETYLFYYSLRWLIERFFYTLKQGCQVEELQLQTAQRLKNAITTYSLIAWNLMFILYHSRQAPHTPCEALFPKEQWQILYWRIHRQTPPSEPPTLQQVIRWIAQLGGFLGRKGDGQPGIKTFWRGYRLFQELLTLSPLVTFQLPFVGKA